jgi:hypothetical protein
MSHSSEVLAGTRKQVIDATLIAILQAARNRKVLSLAVECRKLTERRRDGGMPEKELRELVAGMAASRGVDVDFD